MTYAVNDSDIFANKPQGHILIDGQEVGHTLQCVHCGMHFMPVKGSGKVRGWCYHCKGVTCGAEVCFQCIPAEAKLEFLEGTKNQYTNEIITLLKKGKPVV